MKKILIFLVALVATTTFASAQTFKNGDNVATVNVGFFGGYGIPINAYYERGIYDINDSMSIGVGGSLGVGGLFSSDLSNNFMLSALSNWHYTGFRNFDLYAGLSLGASIAEQSHLLWGVNVGSRYYFNDHIAANLQLGYGIAVIGLGVSFKF